MILLKYRVIVVLFVATFIPPSVFCQNNAVNKPAEFPNGRDSMIVFIQKNLKYPKGEKMAGLVFIQFNVEADGSLTGIKVRRGLGKPFDDEAMRVFSLMPKWQPAIDYGTQKPVKTIFTIPIRFKPDE